MSSLLQSTNELTQACVQHSTYISINALLSFLLFDKKTFFVIFVVKSSGISLCIKYTSKLILRRATPYILDYLYYKIGKPFEDCCFCLLLTTCHAASVYLF